MWDVFKLRPDAQLAISMYLPRSSVPDPRRNAKYNNRV